MRKTDTAAPVAAINSRLLIILPPFLLADIPLRATLLTYFASAGKRGVNLTEQGRCGIGHQVRSKCEGGAAQAAKMSCCEYTDSISDCFARGGGAAVGICWFGSGRGK